MSADDFEILPSTLLSPENMRSNAVFEHAIRHSRLALCITDPSQPDEPIVFANPAFCDLTGYDEEDFIGKNCRFLQGPETTDESLEQIREALSSDGVAMVEIVNYRKSGEKFINALQIGPVFDEDGNLVSQGFAPGGVESTVLVRLAYRYNFMTPLIGHILDSGPVENVYTHMATVVLRNEPYAFE